MGLEDLNAKYTPYRIENHMGTVISKPLSKKEAQDTINWGRFVQRPLSEDMDSIDVIANIFSLAYKLRSTQDPFLVQYRIDGKLVSYHFYFSTISKCQVRYRLKKDEERRN